jgi:hypothetical protein
MLRNVLIALLINASNSLLGQAVKRDTVFLLKRNVEGVYHAIFIDTSPTSKFYKQISNFNASTDAVIYKSSMKYLKENKIRLTERKITDLPHRWIELKMYKGKYYAYKPADFYTHYKAGITDTRFIDYTGEGPVANKIVSYKKIDAKTFEFQLTGQLRQNRKLLIHIIDGKNGIAVFEEVSDNKPVKYFYLMISADKVRNVPIIVNYCETEKQLEYRFDEPNFEELIRKNNDL